jgi:hypothetical protein
MLTVRSHDTSELITRAVALAEAAAIFKVPMLTTTAFKERQGLVAPLAEATKAVKPIDRTTLNAWEDSRTQFGSCHVRRMRPVGCCIGSVRHRQSNRCARVGSGASCGRHWGHLEVRHHDVVAGDSGRQASLTRLRRGERPLETNMHSTDLNQVCQLQQKARQK